MSIVFFPEYGTDRSFQKVGLMADWLMYEPVQARMEEMIEGLFLVFLLCYLVA